MNSTRFSNLYEKESDLKYILLQQIEMWWTQNMTEQDIDNLIIIFKRCLRKNKEVTSMVRIVKEMFSKNVHNTTELSKIIDKYKYFELNEKMINMIENTVI